MDETRGADKGKQSAFALTGPVALLMEGTIVPIGDEIFPQFPGQSDVLLGVGKLQRALRGGNRVAEAAALSIGRSHRPNENRVFPARQLIGFRRQLERSRAISQGRIWRSR
jgi:hypothetical protein